MGFKSAHRCIQQLHTVTGKRAFSFCPWMGTTHLKHGCLFRTAPSRYPFSVTQSENGCTKIKGVSQVPVAHACNLSFSGDSDQEEDGGLKPA
jgi:hypothetical protein